MRVRFVKKSSFSNKSFLIIFYAVECSDAAPCPHCKECKYKRESYKWDKISINLRRFFENRLLIPFPRFIQIVRDARSLVEQKSVHITCPNIIVA